MLRSNGRNAQLQKWYERLASLVAGAQKGLSAMDPARVAMRSGCTLEADGSLQLTYFRQPYTVRPPDYAIQQGDETPTTFVQSLILTYLTTADGALPSGRWISFHDLPGGQFYAQAFRGYAEKRLVRELGTGGVQAFRRAAERLEGTPLDVGGASYAFPILPRLRLAAVYWPGDEDLSSQASILFEDSAPHYMSTDGLAILGSHLVNSILAKARG